MAKNKKHISEAPTQDQLMSAAKRRKAVEATATFGLILVAVGLAAPFTDLTNGEYIRFFKWIYSPGALIFTIARVVGSTDPFDSMRMRRLRRLEFWAGVAFCVGAFFWFYNEGRFSDLLKDGFGAMVYLRETVVFSLVGALIQVIASWMIGYRQKKEVKKTEENTEDKK